MKKAKVVVKKRPLANDSIELRRWCIESAIRWPVDGGYGHAISGISQHMPRGDVDLIGRAKRLLDWVTTP